MPPIRHFDPDLLHEVSQRVIRDEYRLDPNNRALRDAFLGVLAKSLRRYGVQVLAFHFMSNHYRALYKIHSAEKFSRFLAHFHAGLTEAYHRICQTDGKLWGYAQWNPVANDEDSVCSRLKFIMGQAVAAGIVAHPAQFPGASSIDLMLGLAPLVGRVFDATRKCRDRRRKSGPACDASYETAYELALASPDAWRGLSATERTQRYWALADEVARMPLYRIWKRQRLCQPVENKSLPLPAPIAKRQVPARQAADDTHSARRPEHSAPLAALTQRRAPAPLLLAADLHSVITYAARYAEIVAAYRRAKRAWLTRPPRLGRRSLPADSPLPPHTLAGTLPFCR